MIINYKIITEISKEYELEINEFDCFLKSKYDYCNRDVHPYFAQFIRENNIYTIELSNTGINTEISIIKNDIHSSTFRSLIRIWIEKYKGQFQVISAKEFFEHYQNILKTAPIC